jgi:deoxyribodipyrimidine photolyase
LRAAGVDLGGNYPPPIVDLAHTRLAALAAFESIKQRGDPAAESAQIN